MNDLTLWHLALTALAAGALGTLAGFFACALLTTAKAADTVGATLCGRPPEARPGVYPERSKGPREGTTGGNQP